MNAKVEAHSSGADFVKWIGVAAVLVAAVAAFYYFSEQSQLLRVLGMLAAAGVAIAIALQTEKGRVAWRFARDARTEVRKVIWPTRVETTQTTMLVIGMVFLVALMLWLFDAVLLWAIKFVTG
jgi:preprotein translocase subunit SecE